MEKYQTSIKSLDEFARTLKELRDKDQNLSENLIPMLLEDLTHQKVTNKELDEQI